MFITVDARSAARLLRIYGIAAPKLDETAGPRREALGVPVTIDGIEDGNAGRAIRIKIDGRRAICPAPLSEPDAEQLLAAVGGTPNRALAQLLVKCSRLYTDVGIGELHLLLYVQPGSYRTHAVYMLRRRVAAVRAYVS